MKFKGIHRILVPVDFSRTANRAYGYAKDLAPCHDSEVHVVHVLDTHYLTGALNITIEPRDEMVGNWRERTREKLEVVYGGKKADDPTITLHIREGKPYKEILGIAEDLDADLIVIGSHGRSGLERSIFGSVAEKVLKMADIPVLLIKLKGGPGGGDPDSESRTRGSG